MQDTSLFPSSDEEIDADEGLGFFVISFLLEGSKLILSTCINEKRVEEESLFEIIHLENKQQQLTSIVLHFVKNASACFISSLSEEYKLIL